MDLDFWESRWSTGRIGFHRSGVHPDLIGRAPDWLRGASGVLVPLCGKSEDLPWLAARVPTVGVELVPRAVEDLHREHGIEAQVGPRGPFVAWRSEGLTVLQGDVFDLSEVDLSAIDRVWDRAALVALDPPRRRRYVATLREVLQPGTQVLLSSFAYDQQVMPGPPHSVPEDEVRDLYRGASIEILEQDDHLDPRWQAMGHRWWRRSLYRITL